MNKRQLVILVVAVLIVAISVGANKFFASLKEEPRLKKPTKSKRYVKTEPVSYHSVQTSILAYGRVEAAQSIDLLSEVSGRMYAGTIPLKEGQRFTKGALLFHIDDQEASLALKASKSNFLRDIASILPDLKVDFQGNFDEWKEYFGKVDINKALPDLPEAETEKEKTFLATKGIYSTFYTIKSDEVRLRKHKYYAPFNGSITEVAMESGAFISPGTRIGKIMRAGALELKVSVETSDIPWVQLGAEVELSSEDNPGGLTGQVVRISDYVNPNTQSVDIYIQLFPSETKIFDGQFMQAAIPARTIELGMIIPRNAIYNQNEVFVLQDTLLKVKSVNILRNMEEEAIISGLNPGEDLVVEPLVNAHNNMTAYKLDSKEVKLSSKKVAPSSGSSISSSN